VCGLACARECTCPGRESIGRLGLKGGAVLVCMLAATALTERSACTKRLHSQKQGYRGRKLHGCLGSIVPALPALPLWPYEPSYTCPMLVMAIPTTHTPRHPPVLLTLHTFKRALALCRCCCSAAEPPGAPACLPSLRAATSPGA